MDTNSPQSVMDSTVTHNLTTNAPVTNRELLATNLRRNVVQYSIFKKHFNEELLHES